MVHNKIVTVDGKAMLLVVLVQCLSHRHHRKFNTRQDLFFAQLVKVDCLTGILINFFTSLLERELIAFLKLPICFLILFLNCIISQMYKWVGIFQVVLPGTQSYIPFLEQIAFQVRRD